MKLPLCIYALFVREEIMIYDYLFKVPQKMWVLTVLQLKLGPDRYISWPISSADIGQLKRYWNWHMVHQYAAILKWFLRLECLDQCKKWCNYIVCSTLFNNYWVKCLLFSALKFGIKFVKIYDILPPLHIYVTGIWLPHSVDIIYELYQ